MAVDYEVEYNNRARVPEHAEIFARWNREAAAYREHMKAEENAELGLAYGASPRQTVDLFFPDATGHTPLALFIHGGYWRSLEPASFSHMSAGLNARGVAVAVAGYDLCPDVTIGQIINQIRTRRVHVLADRQESGPYKAFDGLEMELQQTDKGPKYFITAGTPTWKGIDLTECQQFLWDSGPEAFLAEYQHDFSAAEQGRVIKEYDEKLHVIRWSDFERVFGVRYIPSHWNCEIGLDVGFSKTHLSVATWVATGAMNSKLPGARFRYRGKSWVEPLVDEIAEDIIAVMLPDKAIGKKHNERFQLRRWVMSAEAKSERKTCQQKHQLPFLACDDDKQAGISQWRHYLRVDRTRPHPFHPDKQIETEITIDGKRVKGLYWELGCPAWFDVVDDDQFVAPRDDRGLALHRQETLDWEWKPTPLTDTGMVNEAPVKAGDDSTDSTRMITAGWGPVASPLTDKEEIEEAMPDELRLSTVASAPLTEDERVAVWLARQEFIEDYHRDQDGDDEKEWERIRNS